MEYSVYVAFLCIGLVAAIGLFLRWLRKNDDYWEKRGVPFVPRFSLIHGLRWSFSKPVHELLQELQTKYGRIYGGFESRKPTLTVSDPDLLRDILVKDFHIFNYRRDVKIGDSIIDKMVSLLKGEDWKRVRTIITPAFTSRRMRKMTHIINESSKTVVENFRKHNEQGQAVDVKRLFGAFTLDVIASAAFATKIDSLNDPENVFVKEAKNNFFQLSLWKLIMFLVLPKWVVVKLRLGNLTAMDFFRDVVLRVIKEREKTGEKYDDVLQMFMDAQDETSKPEIKSASQDDEPDKFGSVLSSESEPQSKYKKLSEEELIAQCVIFFIVGYGTTASVLSYMAYELALNPECQEKLIKEVDEAFEKNKKFDYDVIRDMKYLDCVVSETLRKYPSLVRSERTATEDYKLGNTNIVVEKGTVIGFNIYCMHHDPDFFPHPKVFQPERFSPENTIHPQYAYLPFGAGPRNCLGMRFALMEIKICICNVLKNYRFKKAETTKVPLEFGKGQAFMHVESLLLKVEKRS